MPIDQLLVVVAIPVVVLGWFMYEMLKRFRFLFSWLFTSTVLFMVACGIFVLLHGLGWPEG